MRSEFAENRAAGIVEVDAHGRRTHFIEAGLGIVDVVAGELHLAAHQSGLRALAGGVEQLIAAGHVAGQCGLHLRRIIRHHAHFQRGGAADDVFGFGGVLHARQLHHNAVGAGLLDHRLGHAQFVDAVVQGVDVLLHGIGAHFIEHFLREREG